MVAHIKYLNLLQRQSSSAEPTKLEPSQGLLCFGVAFVMEIDTIQRFKDPVFASGTVATASLTNF